MVGLVPETAVSRGVWTEAALAERFTRVRSVARRVALIDECGGSLFRYLASYLMSVFTVRQRVHAAVAAHPDDQVRYADRWNFSAIHMSKPKPVSVKLSTLYVKVKPVLQFR